MRAVPITQKQAFAFIAENHRHHRPPLGSKFVIAAEKDGCLVGVAVVGRPVARMLDDGETAEVTRLCSNGCRNVCSFLYAKARRVALEMGYRRVITYILCCENGASLRAAGWRFVREAGGGSWSRPSRKREDKAPMERKQLWEAV